MLESRSTRVAFIGAFFALLVVSASTGFPNGFFDKPWPRGLRMLDGIITFATSPFGNLGGAVLFGLLGLVCVWLAYRQKPEGAPRVPRAKRTPPVPAGDADAGFSRKRVISASPQPVPEPEPAPEPAPEPEPAPQAIPDYLAEMLEIATQEREEGPVPAWALLLRSPYASWDHATSWLGGQPKAPAGFDWPRDGDGRAQTFLAQIDLASIGADPETGERPANLPERGALLIFAGTDQAVRLVSGADMARAQPVSPPADLLPVDGDDLGYWGEGTAFTHWPIDLLPYTSTNEDMDEEDDDDEGPSGYRPSVFPTLLDDPQDWITNWAIAAIEADVVITALQNEMNGAARSLSYRETQAQDGKPQPEWKGRQSSHQDMMLAEAPAVLAMLLQWKEHVQAQPPEDPVDPVMLAEVFTQRIALKNRMKGNYGAFHILAGNAQAVWSKLKPHAKGDELVEALRALPHAQRGFAETICTDWRNHRLFGIEPPFPNNGEDLRGWSCLISISADALLGTQSEHDYGMSVWFKRDDLAAGRFDHGMLVRHCAV
jgi:Domain of unknown function (DUF1963)